VNVNLQCRCYYNNNNNASSSASSAAAAAATTTAATTTTTNESILQLIPVRILVNDQPAIQRPVRQYINNNDGMKYSTTSQQPHQQTRNSRPLWEIFETTTATTTTTTATTTTLEEEASSSYYTTLGQYLSTCLPNYFTTTTANDNTGIITTTATSNSNVVYYSIQGVKPSLNCPLVELWQLLSHPDHFLYIIVVVVNHEVI
jgi:hypothetical protein